MSNMWPINAALRCWQKQSMSGTEFLRLYLAVFSKTEESKSPKIVAGSNSKYAEKEGLDQINAVVPWAGKR